MWTGVGQRGASSCCQRASVIAYNKKGNKKSQVVLLSNIPKLGSQGELLSVQQGYMMNYLIPQGLAKKATPEILSEIQAKIEAEEQEKAEVKAKAKAMATALQTLGLIRIAKKVGENDQIFGSVQPQEITAYIEQQTARKLDHRDITLPEMKTLGTYDASIKLHPEVTGFFKVQVTRQAN